MVMSITIDIGSSNIQICYKQLPEIDRYTVKRLIAEFCRKNLTSYMYVHRAKRFKEDKKFFKLDNDKGIFTLPKPFLPALTKYLDLEGIQIFEQPIPPYTTHPIKIYLNSKFVPREHQIEPIKYLSENKDSMFGLECPTGSGKTYCTVKAIANLGMTSMVAMNGLVTQWVDAITEQTNLSRNNDGIYVIQGIASLQKLFKSNIKPKIFVCSTGTLRPYIARKGKYYDLPPYSEFVKRYGIGIKVIDEAHLCFHASCKIDLAANIPTNIYLTATFDNSNTSVRKIFTTYYPNHMRYDGGEYDKYINSTFYAFHGLVPESRCMTPQGYSHAKYEEHMIKRPNSLKHWLEHIIEPIVNSHFIHKNYIGKKMLIFCYRGDMVTIVADYLRERHPEKNVVQYLSEDSYENLEKGEIIVSTHRGTGTGTDIADLMVVLNTISFQSSTAAKQVPGRLRKPKDGTTPDYVDIIDLNLKCHVRHWRERSPIIRSISKSYAEYRL